MSSMMAIAPVDGRYKKLTKPLRDIVSEHGLQKRRTWAEIMWLLFLNSMFGFIKSDNDINKVKAIIDNYTLEDSLEIKEIEKDITHDVKSVEYKIKRKLDALGLSSAKEWTHFALTSEDITNIAIAKMTQESLVDVILPELWSLLVAIEKKAWDYQHVPMLSHTHGQPASPTTVGKEFVVFAQQLREEIDILASIPIRAKLNCATGNFSALHATLPIINWVNRSEDFIKILGFKPNLFTVQTNAYNYLAQIMHAMVRISAILKGFDQDMWLYIHKKYFIQKAKPGEVGSSTMPHKVNPIDFENSEGNLDYVIPIMENFARKLLRTRMQRDLTDSTFLRNLGPAFAHFLIALKNTQKGLTKIEVNKAVLDSDLKGNQAVLAEPIQIKMRLVGAKDPYELLKDATRGKEVTRKDLMQLVDACPELDKRAKCQLKSLTPQSYTGLAVKLVKTYFERHNIEPPN